MKHHVNIIRQKVQSGTINFIGGLDRNHPRAYREVDLTQVVRPQKEAGLRPGCTGLKGTVLARLQLGGAVVELLTIAIAHLRDGVEESRGDLLRQGRAGAGAKVAE